jgi:hypothetical protein
MFINLPNPSSRTGPWAFLHFLQERLPEVKNAINTKLKGLNFRKEIINLIAEKRKLRKNGISQEIHMIKIS